MAINKLKEQLSKAEKGKLDKLTLPQREQLIENVNLNFDTFSQQEQKLFLEEFLKIKENLELTQQVAEHFDPKSKKQLDKQLHLANDYQSFLEKKLGTSLSDYLSTLSQSQSEVEAPSQPSDKKTTQKKQPSKAQQTKSSNTRLTPEEAAKLFDITKLRGKDALISHKDDFLDDLKYLEGLIKEKKRIDRNDPHIKSTIVRYGFATYGNPKNFVEKLIRYQKYLQKRNLNEINHFSFNLEDRNFWIHSSPKKEKQERNKKKNKDKLSPQEKKTESFALTPSDQEQTKASNSSSISPTINKQTPHSSLILGPWVQPKKKQIMPEIEDAEFEIIEDEKISNTSDKTQQTEITPEIKNAITEEIFDDADFGVAFAKFCQKHKLKRADGKDIPWRWGIDTFTIFVDEEGNEYQLSAKRWGADMHDDTWAYALYQFKQIKAKKKDQKSDAPTPTITPTPINTEDEKSTQKLKNPTISHEDEHEIQSPTPVITPDPEPTNIEDEEGEQTLEDPTISHEDEHEIQSPTPVITPTPITIEEPDNKKEIGEELIEGEYAFTINSVISDTLNIHEEQARLAAEETLKAEYAKTNKRNLFKKAKLFLQRGKQRKKLIAEFMENASRDAFGNQVELAAARHASEHQNGLSTINKQAELVSIPEVNILARDFVEGMIDEVSFQTNFNALLDQNPQIKQALNQMQYKGTDILQNLKFEKEQYQLVTELAQTLETGGNISQVSAKIEAFIQKYQKNPDFLKAISSDLDENGVEKLKKYFKHQSALRKAALKNLEVKISILNWGKSAYQIDNSKNENRIHKLGNKLDKIPWYLQVPGYASAGVLLGVAWGAVGLGVVGTSILTTSAFAGTAGFTNFIKKRTHYTKEHNTHEKNLTQNYDLEQAKIAKWQADLEKKGAKNWRTRYKAKRQLDLYNNSTQKMIKTEEVTASILGFATSMRPLTEQDKNQLIGFLLSGKSALDAYYETGHNFLASSSKEAVEEDMLKLHKALRLGAEKLGIDYEQIDEQTHKIIDEEGNTSETQYQDVKNSFLTDYTKANKHFKSQRRRLASKYGVGSAALSAGTAIGMQYAMGTGIFSTESTLQTINSTSQASGNANFNLGSHQLTEGNQIQQTVADQFSGLSDKASVVANYGAGTDATLARAGSAILSPEAYQSKLDLITEQIKNLALSPDQKAAFIKELTEQPWTSDRAKSFTTDYLQGERCAEGLLQIAKGLADSGNQTLIPDLAYDAGRSIAGTGLHQAGERLFNVGLEITEQSIQGQAGSGSTWFVPIVNFFNTFKKENDLRDEASQLENSEYPEHPAQNEQKADSPSQSSADREKIKEKLRTGNVVSGENTTPIPSVRLASPDTENSSDTPQNSNTNSTSAKIKATAQELYQKTKEKYQQHAPTVKEKSQQARDKTKEVAKKLWATTASHIDKLKSKLFEEEISSIEEVEKENKLLGKITNNKDFNLDNFDFENNYYITHQTHHSNAASILQQGLFTGSWLWGTALWWSKESIPQSLTEMENGQGHRGSDSLIIMEFPRADFPNVKELDDISIQLQSKNLSQNFEIPPKYIKTIVNVDKSRANE